MHKHQTLSTPPKESRQLDTPKRPSKIWKVLSSSWAIVVVVVTIMGGISGVFLFIPRITVSPYASTDPKEPFEMNFVLENQGYFRIKDIIYVPTIVSLTSANGRGQMHDVTVGPSGVPPVQAGQKTYLQSAFFHMVVAPGTQNAEFEITIVFKEDWLPKKMFVRHFYFRAKIGTQGDIIWLPSGN